MSEDLTLDQIRKAFADGGADRVYAKQLAPNDNSKNQIYLGGDFGILNTIPASTPEPTTSGSHNRPIFIANVELQWLGDDRSFYPAPNAKLILYPQYPEVRLSGFLLGCSRPPSDLLGKTREPGRLLLLGIAGGRVLSWVGSAESPATKEVLALLEAGKLEKNGALLALPKSTDLSDKEALLVQLRRIHSMGWIDSTRLNSQGERLPCNARNCGGLTLEAELGIRPNGYSDPDFLGWEVKQHKVASFSRKMGGRITLLTPEPSSGVYAQEGVVEFLKRYGYADKTGREDRWNFGGVHKYGEVCKATRLKLMLKGYDSARQKITDSAGGMVLEDSSGTVAAGWEFKNLMAHWNRKHANAVYVPSLNRTDPSSQYWYGPEVRLAEGTDFLKFLGAVAVGTIYLDPGIKAESWSSKRPEVKRRNQFRVNAGKIGDLYEKVTSVSVAS